MSFFERHYSQTTITTTTKKTDNSQLVSFSFMTFQFGLDTACQELFLTTL
jgi:hypothetical protein